MAAVAREVEVEALVNMSQMTVSQMSINRPPRALSNANTFSVSRRWRGRPTGRHDAAHGLPRRLFLPLTSPTVRDRGRIELPFGQGQTSPVATLMSLGSSPPSSPT